MVNIVKSWNETHSLPDKSWELKLYREYGNQYDELALALCASNGPFLTQLTQKHVIVMDNCPSHGVKEVVDAWIDAGWEVEFLPPNMTDRLQVMDLGAISCRPSISFFFQLRLLSLIFLSS